MTNGARSVYSTLICIRPAVLRTGRPFSSSWRAIDEEEAYHSSNAGGGGERVLWSAIAYTQRTQPDTVCLVYSGDYPTASKEAILDRAQVRCRILSLEGNMPSRSQFDIKMPNERGVRQEVRGCQTAALTQQDRFSITIHPEKLIFIPLPSRFLIADDYWQSFTLLGQSLGSVYLAWEGLCGKDGLWGDVFIGMPFACLLSVCLSAIRRWQDSIMGRKGDVLPAAVR